MEFICFVQITRRQQFMWYFQFQAGLITPLEGWKWIALIRGTAQGPSRINIFLQQSVTTIQHLQQTSAVFTNCCINITHRGDVNGVHARTCPPLNLTIWYGGMMEQFGVKEPVFAVAERGQRAALHICSAQVSNEMIKCCTACQSFNVTTGLQAMPHHYPTTRSWKNTRRTNTFESESSSVVFSHRQMKAA